MIHARMRGDAEIRKALTALGKEPAIRRALRKPLYQAAVMVRDDARVLAALVRPRKKKKPASKQLWRTIKVLQRKPKPGRMIAQVIVTAPHGYIVERGTGARYRGVKLKNRKQRRRLMELRSRRGTKQGYTGRMPAKPYLAVALDLNRQNAPQHVIRETWKNIRREKARGLRAR